jgi:hypothetical protein
MTRKLSVSLRVFFRAPLHQWSGLDEAITDIEKQKERE